MRNVFVKRLSKWPYLALERVKILGLEPLVGSLGRRPDVALVLLLAERLLILGARESGSIVSDCEAIKSACETATAPAKRGRHSVCTGGVHGWWCVRGGVWGECPSARGGSVLRAYSATEGFG